MACACGAAGRRRGNDGAGYPWSPQWSPLPVKPQAAVMHSWRLHLSAIKRSTQTNAEGLAGSSSSCPAAAHVSPAHCSQRFINAPIFPAPNRPLASSKAPAVTSASELSPPHGPTVPRLPLPAFAPHTAFGMSHWVVAGAGWVGGSSSRLGSDTAAPVGTRGSAEMHLISFLLSQAAGSTS